jgi:signal transduction histidine kinase/ActR/RegA family two-component response regulator
VRQKRFLQALKITIAGMVSENPYATWADVRGRETRLRLALAAVLAALGHTLNPHIPVWTWLAVVGATQFVDAQLLKVCARPLRPPSAAWQAAYVLSFFVTSLVFSSLGLFVLPRADSHAAVFCVLVIAGALLNLAMVSHRAPRVVLVAWTGHLGPFLALPWLISEARPDPLGGICVTIAALVFIGHLVIATGRSTKAERQIRAALQSAEDALGRSAVAEAALIEARDRAEAGSLAKSAFLATMSHEIRTPLNGVLGMAQAMSADRMTPVQAERLGVIRQSGEALLAILNDILDLSKVEAGKLELEVVEFDLATVATGAYSAFTAIAAKKGLVFTLDVHAAQGRYRGDPSRLRQILNNLISNALKFTEHGEIRVAAAYADGELQVEVTDTGPGIAPQSLTRLFDKFDQLDSSTTRRFGGTGLGLAICRELALLRGGGVSVASTLGLGSRFELRIPLQRVGDASLPSPAPPAYEHHAPIDLRVLAAEDNAVNQLVLKTLLQQLGMQPHVVEDGQAAVAAWESADWDVILMDVQMPVMDGITATQRIRQREGETGRARTPIIALTANAMAHQVQQYLAVGMDGHVAKPIEFAALHAALNGVLAAPSGKVERPAA